MLPNVATVGSGDGAGGVGTPAPTAPADQKVVRIQTRFDSVTLQSHTGDAVFPTSLPFNVQSEVSFTVGGMAVYHGNNTDYIVNVMVDGGSARAFCEPTTREGTCQVGYRDVPVITMG
ncbi:hypothetical protein ACIGXA_20625 [Streptomyces fildesensis]|uniref:Uncharacterized protein n=1 Tax=Streptomyces fildesensis TaxID=375757 RepID=A0ABW8CC37_9ACTN